MTIFKSGIVIMATVFILASCATDPFKGRPGTPLRNYGQLQVIGTELCDSDGNPVQLRGVSAMDIYDHSMFVNTETLEWLRDDWDMEVFRAAMYTESYGRNLAQRKKQAMINAVESALEAGVYVIIDWHILADNDPMKWADEAVAFFDEMAGLFHEYPNVLYEICNEPNGDITWRDNVKPYAELVIPVIRHRDPDSIIIVGSPTWSQDVDIAAADPLDYDGIMYSAHFYAGTHGRELMDKIDTARDLGAAVFISEWGTTQSSGDGGVFTRETIEWMNFINSRNLSWANWSLSNVFEDSAILRASAGTRGDWQDSDISDSGLLVRAIMRGGQSAVFADGFENNRLLAGKWNSGGVSVIEGNAFSGNFSAEMPGGAVLTRALSLLSFRNSEVEFAFSTADMSSDDTLFLEWYDGTQWQPAGEWRGDREWKQERVKLPGEADGEQLFQIRFRTSAGATGRVLIDDVRITAELVF